jgi:predicted CXXCH cytochrome family protein
LRVLNFNNEESFATMNFHPLFETAVKTLFGNLISQHKEAKHTLEGGTMKRFLLCFIVLTVLISVLAVPVLAQTQTGRIRIVSVPDRYKSGNKNQSTTSLKSVGVGSRVVLAPKVFAGTGTKNADSTVVVTGATWTLTNPFGVSKTIQDTAAGLNGKLVYFVPDTVGDWTVSMTATTVLGTTASVQTKITAAKFIGAGISMTTTQSVPSGCACHLVDPTNFSNWSKTNHATAVKRKTTDPTGHFSFSCLSCHSVGYDGLTSSGNDGFDDVAKSENFTTIPANAPGVFDTLVAKYPKSMSKTGIQCENCHGPAGQHVASFPKAGDNKLDASLSSDVCAPCHFSSDRHGKGFAWSGSGHALAVNPSGSSREMNLDRAFCDRCHTAQGYVNTVVNHKPDPVPASSTDALWANPQPVTCAACHDPHDGSNEMQLRTKTVADACLGCHVVRLSTSGLHASHQGSMLVGANATPMGPELLRTYLTATTGTVQEYNARMGLWGGWELPGYSYENSSHSNIQERCVACHMAKSPSFIAAENAGFPSSKPDTMMNKLGGHTFNVVTTYISGKDTTEVLNTTGCAECHGTVSMEFIEKTQDKTKSMLATLYALLPKRDSTFSSTNPMGRASYFNDSVAFQTLTKAPLSSKRKLTDLDRAAVYNYYFVYNEPSLGVHNYNYAKGLLTSSIEQLRLAAGAASIVSLKDVPFDNGKRVQVVWNAFPSESWSYNTVVNYGVWRKDPLLPSLNSIKKVNSYTEMMQATGQGSQVVMGGSVWSYVGGIPASGLAQYSYVAPTLFDSTKVSGQRWTVFYVAGYSKDNAVVYSTQPDSGFSTDNVSPLAPSGISASFATNTVTLKWKANTETDVYQYAIYRGTTASFNPTGTTPVAKVRTPEYRDLLAQTGVTYYYKISALDVSGNEGAFTAVSVLTGIESTNGLPTEFALNQNYPNPFNPTTEIAFSIPKQSPVKIVVYGLSGEVVATIVNQTMSAGNYRVSWNGRTDDGRAVASGVYFYHLQAVGFTATKKMTFLK